jgi:transcriptional regulator with XRE-family HTH domain
MKKPTKTTKQSKSISNYSLPERLKYLRVSRDLTQGELAKKAGVAQSTIAQIESERKDPSISTLKQVAQALGVEIAILFASDDVHVFDMKRLNEKYHSVSDLNPTLHVAIDRVVRYAKKIGFI